VSASRNASSGFLAVSTRQWRFPRFTASEFKSGCRARMASAAHRIVSRQSRPRKCRSRMGSMGCEVVSSRIMYSSIGANGSWGFLGKRRETRRFPSWPARAGRFWGMRREVRRLPSWPRFLGKRRETRRLPSWAGTRRAFLGKATRDAPPPKLGRHAQDVF